MSTLTKMVLHIELKTNIQKDLSKSQIFTRKIFVAKFHYSQTIFLPFTEILLAILVLML